MNEEEKWVGVISPWEKLPELVKRKFRVESLPTEKKVMVWREDLQSENALREELAKIGVGEIEVRKQKVVAKWQNVE